MSENAGLYQKFDVRRRGGNDRPDAAYFTLDVVNDPHARYALRAYALSCRGYLPDLAAALDALIAELESGTPGPCVEALRTPRPTGDAG